MMKQTVTHNNIISLQETTYSNIDSLQVFGMSSDQYKKYINCINTQTPKHETKKYMDIPTHRCDKIN